MTPLRDGEPSHYCPGRGFVPGLMVDCIVERDAAQHVVDSGQTWEPLGGTEAFRGAPGGSSLTHEEFWEAVDALRARRATDWWTKSIEQWRLRALDMAQQRDEARKSADYLATGMERLASDVRCPLMGCEKFEHYSCVMAFAREHIDTLRDEHAWPYVADREAFGGIA